MTRDERRNFWHEHVSAWRSGDESQAAYCRRMGLSPMTFSQWKRRFEREHLAAAVSDGSERAALVEVELADTPAPEAASGVTVACGGVQLQLAPGFDAATLQRAVAALADARR